MDEAVGPTEITITAQQREVLLVALRAANEEIQSTVDCEGVLFGGDTQVFKKILDALGVLGASLSENEPWSAA